MSRITRRDFINGTLMVAGASLLPAGCTSNAVLEKLDPTYYPPSLTGLRGSHPGANVHSHARAWNGKSDWGPTARLNEVYDLIVVGSGLSGLSAAYFFQQKHGSDKKVLILDNHDDFGGHAKRNEHSVGNRTLITYGGSQSIVEPKHGSEVVHGLLADIGVDVQRFHTAYDRSFHKRNNLGAVTYFNEEVFGENKVVRHPYCNYPNYIDGIIMSGKLSNEEAANQAPLSQKGKDQLLRVLNGGLHTIEVPEGAADDYVASLSYFDYLRNTLGVDDPGVLRMARHSGLDWALSGTDLMTVRTAKSVGALGFVPKEVYDEDNPYIYHYPDGNAGVARALVKKMIPDVGQGNNAEELVLSKFDYTQLDKISNTVRIRQNSTVVNVKHAGDPASADEVLVNYINDNQSYQVKGKNVVLACYNMMIPHIVDGLPVAQAEALKMQTKSPLQYSSIGLKNWRAFQELEIGMAMSPGNMHQAVLMDFPVSIGGYEYTAAPEDPCVVQMISCPYGETVGAPRRDQYREARLRMLGLTFEDYEDEIRAHLAGMLPKKLFDFERDVASITINRWAHGYTVGGPGESVSIGRQPFGRITVANCDSAPGADMKTAIDMAARAVNELG